MLTIDIKTQTLSYKGKNYLISTAKNGVGYIEGSFCTPLGHFCVAQKIGEELPIKAVLVGRVATGEVYSNELARQYPDRDWVLTRILWLDGLEAHNKNTKMRYIYIHGTPDCEPMGLPNSKGCIRMKNNDMIEIFDTIHINETILIQ